MNTSRKNLIEHLKELLSDEFNPNEIMYKSKKELILYFIDLAYHYKINSK